MYASGTHMGYKETPWVPDKVAQKYPPKQMQEPKPRRAFQHVYPVDAPVENTDHHDFVSQAPPPPRSSPALSFPVPHSSALQVRCCR